MEIGGLVNKLEKNAMFLSAAAGIYLRSTEGNAPLGDIIKNIPIEVTRLFRSQADLQWKLWDAPHAPQAITKIGIALYLASEFGLTSQKTLGMNLIKGGLLASAITPGSEPYSGTSNTASSRGYGGY